MIFNHLLAVYSPRILKNNIIQKGLSFFLRPFGLTLIDFITLNNITSNRWDGRLTYYLNKIDKYLAKEKIIFDVGSDRGQIIHFFYCYIIIVKSLVSSLINHHTNKF